MRGSWTFVSVDETLYPYRRKIRIKYYNPLKPAKYGLLYRGLCDAVVPYAYLCYHAMANLTVLIMNIILQELTSIRNIL